MVPGRRFALVLVLACVVLACSEGVAAANSGQLVNVTIFPPGGGIKTESVSLSTLQGGQCATYGGPDIELYRQDGTETPDQAINRKAAWSLATVVGCLSPPVSMGAVQKVLVEQSGAPELSQNSQLLPGDLSSPSDFANSAEAPLIYSDGTGIIYDRPWRGGADANAQDQVVSQDPSPFMLEVFERTVLGATVVPSANPVPVGATVSFTAQAAGMGPGLSYSWDFDGAGPPSTGANPTATYTSAGTYAVTVQVTDSAGDVAQSSPLLIKVGSATPTTPTSPTAPATGPTNSNGNTPGGISGAAKTPGKGNGAGTSPTGGNAKRTSPGQTTTPGSGGGSSGPGPSGSGSSSSGSTAASPHGGRGHASHSGGHAVTARKARPTTTTAPATFVTGRLISDVNPLPAGSSPLVHALAGGLVTAPAARRPITASIAPALAAGLAVALLFSFGAGRELRIGRNLRIWLFGS
jgi:hypothetical protein